MTSPRNQSHIKRGNERPVDDVDVRDLEAKNEALGRAPEEPRNIQKAGGGVKGPSMGGAHVGRYDAAPGRVHSNREPKVRGQDREDRVR